MSAEAALNRKMIAKLETQRKSRLWRKYPSHATKRRYHTARVRLGLSPNATGSLDWSRINKKTTFIWKSNDLSSTAHWVIESTFESFNKHPTTSRLQIVLHFIQHGFGIMPSDILSDQRSPVLVIPRMIAMVCVKRSGVAIKEVARRFKRDHTCVSQAELKVGHLFEGLPHHEQDPLPLGPTPEKTETPLLGSERQS